MQRRSESDPPPPANCLRDALRLLQYRWRAVRELSERLERKGFDPSTVSSTIERLTADGWLDDERFARELVRARKRKHQGPRRIERDLEGFGIERDLARRIVKESFSGDEEIEQLRTLCRRKIEQIQARYGNAHLRSEVGRRKLARHLLQRGYDGGSVRSVIAEELRRTTANGTEDENH